MAFQPLQNIWPDGPVPPRTGWLSGQRGCVEATTPGGPAGEVLSERAVHSAFF